MTISGEEGAANLFRFRKPVDAVAKGPSLPGELVPGRTHDGLLVRTPQLADQARRG